jgi:hypothetical protein
VKEKVQAAIPRSTHTKWRRWRGEGDGRRGQRQPLPEAAPTRRLPTGSEEVEGGDDSSWVEMKMEEGATLNFA